MKTTSSSSSSSKSANNGNNGINKSRLFKIAHTIFKMGGFSSFGAALKHAWKVIKLRAKMMLGEVVFSYRTKSGNIREAVGKIISYTRKPMANGKFRKEAAPNVIKYWDVDANGFRSFLAENLL